jgi:chemotaxis protein methyltransferase CheR
MRWEGFRKVRGQVCKRLRRRLNELGLVDLDVYRDYLDRHPDEWRALDGFCRITISRFHRDRRVFEYLRDRLLPELSAARRDRGSLRCWSAGCASGEEPYTVSIIWNLELRNRFPGVSLEIVATDAERRLLQRARVAEYSPGSLKELAPFWREEAFEPGEPGWRLREPFREGVSFHLSDIREEMPDGLFDLVLFRNLAFTYFDHDLQREILDGIVERLATDGALVIGSHESLPPDRQVVAPSEPILAPGEIPSIYRPSQY